MIVKIEFDLNSVLESETENKQAPNFAFELDKMKKSKELQKEIVASMMKLKLLFDKLIEGE